MSPFCTFDNQGKGTHVSHLRYLAAAVAVALSLVTSSTHSRAALDGPGTPVPTRTATGTPTPPPPPDPVKTAGAVLLKAINKDRAAHHIAPLALSSTESKCSLKHSRHMASMQMLSHDQFPADICVPHLAASENVGVAMGDLATSLETIHHTMMAEGPCPHHACPGDEFHLHGHYVNLINSLYRHIGIGIYSQNGTVWLTEDFTD